jgi:hypothetical protein
MNLRFARRLGITGLMLALACLETSCLPQLLLAANEPVRQEQAISILLNGYMAAMRQKDAELPYLLLSAQRKRTLSQSQIAQEFDDYRYVLYDGYVGHEVISVQFQEDHERGARTARMVARVDYEAGSSGVMVADVVEEGAGWTVDNVAVYVTPAKVVNFIEAHPGR